MMMIPLSMDANIDMETTYYFFFEYLQTEIKLLFVASQL